MAVPCSRCRRSARIAPASSCSSVGTAGETGRAHPAATDQPRALHRMLAADSLASTGGHVWHAILCPERILQCERRARERAGLSLLGVRELYDTPSTSTCWRAPPALELRLIATVEDPDAISRHLARWCRDARPRGAVAAVGCPGEHPAGGAGQNLSSVPPRRRGAAGLERPAAPPP